MAFKKKNHSHPSMPVVINRDGSLNIHRPKDPTKLFFDLYHYLLSISWPKFFLFLVGLFFLTNIAFGSLYYLAGEDALKGAHTGKGFDHLVDCFFYSAQLFNAPFTPVGIWPNLLATFQSYLGILTLVVITGLFYARFARPHARVIFSNNAIIGTYNHKPCFSFRVANERLNQIIEAKMVLTLTKNVVSAEGETSRKFFPMKVESDYSPVFALSWTIRHFIDHDSPLFGMDAEKLKECQAVIFASLSGLDDTFSQTISARSVYRYDEIVYNKRFKDILVWKDHKIKIDLKGIHDVI